MPIFDKTIPIQNGRSEISVTTNRAASKQHIPADDIYLNIGPVFLNITADEAKHLAQALIEATDPSKREPILQAVHP